MSFLNVTLRQTPRNTAALPTTLAFNCQRANRRASPGLTFKPYRLLRQHGGDDRDRTDGLRLAKPALSQLSYIPYFIVHRTKFNVQSFYVELRTLNVELTIWWARVESNYRPHAYQACALTN